MSEPLTADPEPRWIDDPMGEALRIADQFPDGFIATLLEHFATLDAAREGLGLDETPQQPEATGDAAEPPWQECGHVHCRTRLAARDRPGLDVETIKEREYARGWNDGLEKCRERDR